MSTTTGGSAIASEALGDREPIGSGQSDIEQHERRTEVLGQARRRLAVLGLADHAVAVGLEEGARSRTEVGVVVDDQDGAQHGPMMLPDHARVDRGQHE